MKMLLALTAMLVLTGCDPKPAAAPPADLPPAAAPAPATRANLPTDAWLGRWTGPEGMYLDIAADGGANSGRYAVTNRYTLDDEGKFVGLAKLDTIVFTRGDKEVTLRAGDGDATGMKWLAGKSDCLIVAAGEGYCRG